MQMTLINRLRHLVYRMTDIELYDEVDMDTFDFMVGIRDPAEVAELTMAIEAELGMKGALNTFDFVGMPLTLVNMADHLGGARIGTE